LTVVIAAGAELAGCSSGPARQEIHGAITLDEQPVAEGNMRFTRTDGQGSATEVFIKEGKYTATLLAGTYKVEIYAPRIVGKLANRPPGPGAEAKAVVETLPAKYNVESMLTAEVEPGIDEIKFDLTSK
jgi:hypothetical protein